MRSYIENGLMMLVLLIDGLWYVPFDWIDTKAV